jgi:hypothetical protein
VSDSALRSLERSTFDGDPYAQVAHYRARLRAAEFGADTERVEQALEVACKDGEPDEAVLEVLGLALAGDLAHGSWIKLTLKSQAHSHGPWWCVQYWRTGYVYEGPPGLQFLDHVTLCAAGRTDENRRRGFNKYVSTWRQGFVHELPRALEYFAEYLDVTYRPGVGLQIWEARRRLPAAKGRVTKLVNEGAVGPGALARLNKAKAEVEGIEALIKKLEA